MSDGATRYVIVSDTICTGYQPIGDGEGNPVIFDTEAEAQAEIDSDPEFYKGEYFVVPESEIGHKTIWYGSEA